MLMTKLKLVVRPSLVAGGLFASGAGVAAHGRRRVGLGPRCSGGPGSGRQIALLQCVQPGIGRARNPPGPRPRGRGEERPARLQARLVEARDRPRQPGNREPGPNGAMRQESQPGRSPRSPSPNTRRGFISKNADGRGEDRPGRVRPQNGRGRLEWADRMFQKKYLSKGQNVADKLAWRTLQVLARAGGEEGCAREYMREKTMKELGARASSCAPSSWPGRRPGSGKAEVQGDPRDRTVSDPCTGRRRRSSPGDREGCGRPPAAAGLPRPDCGGLVTEAGVLTHPPSLAEINC